MLAWAKKHAWLLLILLLALMLRLPSISTPPLDWHAFRQADTASVTREYVKHGINLLQPEYHDLANIQSGLDNLAGYRMVEFPLLNAVTAGLVKYLDLPLITTSRAVSVAASLGTIVGLYLLVRELSGEKIALNSAILYAVLPFSVYYSRVILPEPAMLFFSTWSFLAFFKWLQYKSIGWYLGWSMTLSIALLLKPTIAFLLPVYAGLVLFFEWPLKWQPSWLLKKGLTYTVQTLPGMAVAGASLIGWRSWIQQFPSGIPDSIQLFNSDGIRLRPAWFRWLFWERLTKLITGFVGTGFLALNVFKIDKDLLVYGSWGAGILAYLIVVATGNVRHDYYQVMAVPLICIGIARGAQRLFEVLRHKLPPVIAALVIGLLLMAMIGLSNRYVRGYYAVNHPEYIEAGRYVDQIVPVDALVIAPAFGDTQFLFQTNRRGWPIGFEIEDKISKGAQYYVSTSYDDEARMLEENYTVLEKNDTFILIDLNSPKQWPHSSI